MNTPYEPELVVREPEVVRDPLYLMLRALDTIALLTIAVCMILIANYLI